MQVIESTYVVTLRDYPEEIPAKERIAAETRYAQALEKQLGGPEQVAAALDTLHSLEESPPEVVSPSDLTCSRPGVRPVRRPSRRGSGIWGKGMGRTLKCGWCEGGGPLTKHHADGLALELPDLDVHATGQSRWCVPDGDRAAPGGGSVCGHAGGERSGVTVRHSGEVLYAGPGPVELVESPAPF